MKRHLWTFTFEDAAVRHGVRAAALVKWWHLADDLRKIGCRFGDADLEYNTAAGWHVHVVTRETWKTRDVAALLPLHGFGRFHVNSDLGRGVRASS